MQIADRFAHVRAAAVMMGQFVQMILQLFGEYRFQRRSGALVDELLVKYRISHDSLEHSIREKWPELVGVANASYSHPVVVERNLLVVLASHAVVRNELFHHREVILAKLKKLPGCDHIKGIALRAG